MAATPPTGCIANFHLHIRGRVLTKKLVISVYTNIGSMVEYVVRIPHLRSSCDVIKCIRAQRFAMGIRQMKIVPIPILHRQNLVYVRR
jgi:hypothetical protein